MTVRAVGFHLKTGLEDTAEAASFGDTKMGTEGRMRIIVVNFRDGLNALVPAAFFASARKELDDGLRLMTLFVFVVLGVLGVF